MRQFILSSHAAQRVRERTSLTPEEVTALLNRDRTVVIGFQDADNRVHLAFHSAPDDRIFVAVVDLRGAVVATILTLGQCECRYGCVDPDRLRSAINKAGVTPPPRPELGLHVIARMQSPEGHLVNRHLGHVHGYSLLSTPEELAREPELLASVKALCAERGIAPQDVYGIFVRARSKDVPVYVPLPVSAIHADQHHAFA